MKELMELILAKDRLRSSGSGYATANINPSIAFSPTSYLGC